MRNARPIWNGPKGAIGALAVAAVATALTGCSLSHGSASTANQAASRAKISTTSPARVGSSAAAGTVASLLQAGITQAEQKNWSAATTTFTDVIAISPKNVYALYNLGLVDQSTDNVTGADDYYNEAIKADAKYTPALYNLAITEEAGAPAKALGLYQQIVQINPQASTAYLRMAFVYSREGEPQHAKAAQAKAIAIDPTLGKYPLPAAVAK